MNSIWTKHSLDQSFVNIHNEPNHGYIEGLRFSFVMLLLMCNIIRIVFIGENMYKVCEST